MRSLQHSAFCIRCVPYAGRARREPQESPSAKLHLDQDKDQGDNSGCGVPVRLLNLWQAGSMRVAGGCVLYIICSLVNVMWK